VFARDAIPDYYHAPMRCVIKKILAIRRWGNLDQASCARNSIRAGADVSLVRIENDGCIDVGGSHLQRFTITVGVGGLVLLHPYDLLWRISFLESAVVRVQLLRSPVNAPFAWEGRLAATFAEEKKEELKKDS
jgi:hypothetical protein